MSFNPTNIESNITNDSNDFSGIYVAGLNDYHQISSESDLKQDENIINIPQKINNLNNLISYSVYFTHSIYVDNTGSAYAIGNNTDQSILGNLPEKLDDWTRITITRDKKELSFISAVCGFDYTLYLVKYQESDTFPFLAYVHKDEKAKSPLFLDTGDMNILKIFGGRVTSGAIDDTGSIIMISSGIFSNHDNRPAIAVLPDSEKAVQLACLHKSFIALSASGQLYEFDFSQNFEKKYPIFSPITVTSNPKFVQIAGTWEHCLALTSQGHVFGFGPNHFGHLGRGDDRRKVDKFVHISTFKTQIKSIYAGSFHSLFITKKNVLFACGQDKCGELMVDPFPQNNAAFYPVKTVLSNVAFCIAGFRISVAFVSCNVPKNMPNSVVETVLFTNEMSFNPDPRFSFSISKIRFLLHFAASLEQKKNRIRKLFKKIDQMQAKVGGLERRTKKLAAKLSRFKKSKGIDRDGHDENDNDEEEEIEADNREEEEDDEEIEHGDDNEEIEADNREEDEDTDEEIGDDDDENENGKDGDEEDRNEYEEDIEPEKDDDEDEDEDQDEEEIEVDKDDEEEEFENDDDDDDDDDDD